jgi:hypothetical protein
MNHTTDLLTETFAAHEHLAPDAADVLAKAHRIAQSYNRRRWAVRATGGAVLGAGLVAGSVSLPGRLGQHSNEAVLTAQPLADPSTSPTGSPAYTQAMELDAFFAAGYDYQDSQQLATLWGESGGTATKAEAGLKLLEGQTLPIPPSGTPETKTEMDQDAFFAAGYDYDDAVALGRLWNETNLDQVKADAGAKILAGQALPVQPSGPSQDQSGSAAANAKAMKEKMAEAKNVKDGATGGSDSTAADDAQYAKQYAAYAAAGYDYDDAVALGKVWNETDLAQIKAEAGQKLLDGQTLPVAPSGTPETATEKDQDAFFNAGYDYNDAVTLGQMWHESNLDQVKAEAGQKLLDGQTLPISP